MKLGIDLDNVVVDMQAQCALAFGYDPDECQAWDDVIRLAGCESYGQWMEEVRRRSIFEKAPHVEGALSGIGLLKEAGHDICFITSRPEWAGELTRAWLNSNFLTDKVHVFSNNESKSTVPCDLYLDDSPHVLSDLMDNTDNGVLVVRYERPWNKHSKDWDFSVANWEEFVTLVAKLEAMEHPTQGNTVVTNSVTVDGVTNAVSFDGKQYFLPGPRVASTMAHPLVDDEEVTVTLQDYGNMVWTVTDSVSGGMKGQKNQQASLLPWDALMKVSEHYAAGADKYSRDNWQKGYAWHLTFDALQRHLAAWWQGEDLDDEGLEHINAVCFHALALRTFTLRGIGTDDRPQ